MECKRLKVNIANAISRDVSQKISTLNVKFLVVIREVNRLIYQLINLGFSYIKVFS